MMFLLLLFFLYWEDFPFVLMDVVTVQVDPLILNCHQNSRLCEIYEQSYQNQSCYLSSYRDFLSLPLISLEHLVILPNTGDELSAQSELKFSKLKLFFLCKCQCFKKITAPGIFKNIFFLHCYTLPRTVPPSLCIFWHTLAYQPRKLAFVV